VNDVNLRMQHENRAHNVDAATLVKQRAKLSSRIPSGKQHLSKCRAVCDARNSTCLGVDGISVNRRMSLNRS
jgi:hypothetical protein